jgi:hypothetical protein
VAQEETQQILTGKVAEIPGFISATEILAKGGGGGTGNVPSVSGATPFGATVGSGAVPGSIGDVIYTGGNGRVGRTSSFGTVKVWGGGGGGSAGSMGNAPGPGLSQSIGGTCGNGAGGDGGSGGGGYSVYGTGNNGNDFGGGGGGASVLNTQPTTVHYNGGNGGNGRIIISEAAPLPVQLVYFKGSYTKDAAILFKWKVASQNTKSVTYSIEGSSDGNSFNEIYSHQYSGKIPQEYSCNYQSVNKDKVLYRLKSVGEAGTVKYSNVIQVNNNNQNTGISLYPNPSKAMSFIDYAAPAKGNISVNMYDMNGEKVYFRQYAIEAALNQLPVNITTLTEGIYVVEMLDSNGKLLFAAKLIKQ